MRHSNFLRHFLRILKHSRRLVGSFRCFSLRCLPITVSKFKRRKLTSYKHFNTYILVKVVLAATEIRGLFEVSQFNTLEMRQFLLILIFLIVKQNPLLKTYCTRAPYGPKCKNCELKFCFCTIIFRIRNMPTNRWTATTTATLSLTYITLTREFLSKCIVPLLLLKQ